jgi:hypothetical protein
VATLFVQISQRHAIDVSTIREYAQQRDVIFDAAVLLVFAFAYVVIAYQLVGVVMRRFSGDERFGLVAAVIFLSVMTVFVATLVGDIWSIAAEVFRVGNGHLSYRTERLPWRQYRTSMTATALTLFWLVAAIRIKTRRGQTAERRTMFDIDEKRYPNG